MQRLKNCVQSNMRLHILMTLSSSFFKQQSCVYVAEIQPLVPTAVLCTILMDNSTAFGILEPGILQGNKNCHHCLVRPWPFTGTGGCVAGLFTFLSRQSTVNQLRACKRNWLKTIIINTKTKKSEFSVLTFRTLCWAAKCGRAHKWTAGN